ncbi:hypothetical protein MVLG_06215 [Microbotryum lychnidis-dioicae p1A1 Lamole]|uniref:Uncharacterized protein n=1 Tax=Microbotryum lychnidis-dioicae (strain p1A1 Lamole / MvSl-1064) TaxID=683840 RepID=U5HGL0_USTV1|nr:hypothetical protein MVLG_06215 [Microbotryum lychnidis-dioicae p1A1 Lamole]|eukprot:KDE03285.1 hypothetical protein MVLG_06215 [Microbotryum lychnidis-dioicae p1A1 Lamole]
MVTLHLMGVHSAENETPSCTSTLNVTIHPAAWTLRRSRRLVGSAPSVCIAPLLASMRKFLPNRGQGRCKDPFEALQLAISRLCLWVQDSPSVAVEASWGLNGLYARVVGVKAADDPVTIQEEDSSLAAAVAIGEESEDFGTGLRRKELLNHGTMLETSPRDLVLSTLQGGIAGDGFV